MEVRDESEVPGSHLRMECPRRGHARCVAPAETRATKHNAYPSLHCQLNATPATAGASGARHAERLVPYYEEERSHVPDSACLIRKVLFAAVRKSRPEHCRWLRAAACGRIGISAIVCWRVTVLAARRPTNYTGGVIGFWHYLG
eukprot:553840-Pyramimonas_sp.AAC.2